MNATEETKKLVKILNFGCSANRAIAEGLTGKLKRQGYLFADSVEEAEIIIVNTCIVKQNTEHRMKSLLKSFSKTKDIIVTGCLPVVMNDWISKNIPNAKVLFPEAANQIGNLLRKFSVEEIKTTPPHVWSQLYSEDRLRFNPVITIIEIARGCLGSCAFCIVKNIKGDIRSRSTESILEETRRAIHNGSKEIWLTSQDSGVYGWDFSPKVFLPSLIDSISRVEGQFFVRIGMMTPKTLERFFSPLITQLRHPKVFTFLHLPIQSGSDSILHAMRRKENKKYFLNLISRLREEVDDLTLATDIIVGFPGESEEDFKETKKLLREAKPLKVNISKYTGIAKHKTAQYVNS
ncbi:MAG: tRNA (N(6)-L-threonylcarbamoyladenosine(37)-C(2))-methylthiotransferase [Candidatus Heimdallarchaeota archaeon]|nr:MAG: tRNA (N(6)-L-threonylcarbamoyladenosine(37)-C(2))-methylthiotransferase [Candidatus Heimdallarchaeota archaeon]